MKRLMLPLLAAALFIVGCAQWKPVPEGYKGPVAIVSDSREYENRGKAAFFVLAAVNGKPIETSLDATRKASYGKGFSLSAMYIEREVPAEPMKVTLLGTHETAAPIHELLSRAGGHFQSVEGVVNFAPSPNIKYIVKGELSPDGTSVWIEVLQTGERVTEKISSK